MKNYAICCDWGTSSLRTRLVNREDSRIIDKEVTDEGISSVFQKWKVQKNQDAANGRKDFYMTFLNDHLTKIECRADINLDGLPVIISGMVSSNIGMMELPYASTPFSLKGDNTVVANIEPTHGFNHPIILLSGVRDGNEVMRGEETQLIGLTATNALVSTKNDIVFLLPGTHSKHVQVSDGSIKKFKTFMTGELFNILSQNGLLKQAVQCSDDLNDDIDSDAFREGILKSKNSEILNSLFEVRTNVLLKKFDKTQNYHYLSGLLIGYELRDLLEQDLSQIVLTCEPKLFNNYKLAIEHLGLLSLATFINPLEAEAATVKGQILSANKLTNSSDL